MNSHVRKILAKRLFKSIYYAHVTWQDFVLCSDFAFSNSNGRQTLRLPYGQAPSFMGQVRDAIYCTGNVCPHSRPVSTENFVQAISRTFFEDAVAHTLFGVHVRGDIKEIFDHDLADLVLAGNNHFEKIVCHRDKCPRVPLHIQYGGMEWAWLPRPSTLEVLQYLWDQPVGSPGHEIHVDLSARHPYLEDVLTARLFGVLAEKVEQLF